MSDAAVAFFVFNRPDATRQVFEAIRRKSPSRLYIIADGPRKDVVNDEEDCRRVREIVEDVDWNCAVQRNFSDINTGCRDRLSSGLEWVFSNEEEAIILEDDCVPHQDFFYYCNELLERYRDDGRVMMITGTNFRPEQNRAAEQSYFFSKHFSVWGWASWRRAWKGYDKSLSTWRRDIGKDELVARLGGALKARQLAQILDRVKDGEIDTWDYQWTYHCLVSGGLAVTPSVNLITNVGTEGVHTRAGMTVHNRGTGGLRKPMKGPETFLPDADYDEYVWRIVDRLSVFRVVAGFFGNKIRTSRYLSWAYPRLRGLFRAARL